MEAHIQSANQTFTSMLDGLHTLQSTLANHVENANARNTRMMVALIGLLMTMVLGMGGYIITNIDTRAHDHDVIDYTPQSGRR